MFHFQEDGLQVNLVKGKGNIALKQPSDAMAIYPYAPLREKKDCFVSQKEHTIVVEKEVELFSGTKVRLSNEDFTFEIES